MERRSELHYYNVSLPEAARQFDVTEADVHSWVQRGALDGQFCDGQWWVHLGPRRGQETVTHLWHGTTRDRADTLVGRGFWMVTREKQIWLTSSELSARTHAIGRARQRGNPPVLVSCEVDLERHPIFWRRSSQIYVFHQPLGPEVIKSVQEVDEREQGRRFRMEVRRRTRKESVNIGITRNSGALGILLWINEYMHRHGMEPVTVENGVVREVTEWVEREYADGRDSPIADAELEVRARSLLETLDNPRSTPRQSP